MQHTFIEKYTPSQLKKYVLIFNLNIKKYLMQRF